MGLRAVGGRRGRGGGAVNGVTILYVVIGLWLTWRMYVHARKGK